jgi:hypothetical protein
MLRSDAQQHDELLAAGQSSMLITLNSSQATPKIQMQATSSAMQASAQQRGRVSFTCSMLGGAALSCSTSSSFLLSAGRPWRTLGGSFTALIVEYVGQARGPPDEGSRGRRSTTCRAVSWQEQA